MDATVRSEALVSNAVCVLTTTSARPAKPRETLQCTILLILSSRFPLLCNLVLLPRCVAGISSIVALEWPTECHLECLECHLECPG